LQYGLSDGFPEQSIDNFSGRNLTNPPPSSEESAFENHI